MKSLVFCLLLLIGVSLIFSAHAQVSVDNEVGTLNLDKDKIFVSRYLDEQIKIYGSLTDNDRGTKVTITITDPNGDIDSASQQVFTTDVGYYETLKILNRDSLIGTYTVQASADNKIIGSLLFVVQESDNSSSIQNQIPLETVLTLEMTSNQDSIRVFPKYVNSIGNELSFTSDRDANFIKIYIDNQYIISVKPNQWSDDITIGYGPFDVYATSIKFTDSSTGDTYTSAKSDTQSVYLQQSTTSEFTTEVIITEGSSIPGCETSDTCYSPASLTINSGDTVKWKNVDTFAHTVTSGSPDDGISGVFDSSLLLRDESFENTFDIEGRYDYFCMIHPWMTGIIFVGTDQREFSIPIEINSVTDLGTSSISAIENRIVTLDGGGDYSSTYLWEQIDGQHVDLSSYYVDKPQFTAPNVANGQIEVITFAVTESSTISSSSKIIEIFVNPVNRNPTVSAGQSQEISKNLNPVILVGDALDPDGDSLTYSWKQVSGQYIQLSNTNGKQITILPNDIDYSQTTPLTFQLTVDDGFGGTARSTVNVYPIYTSVIEEQPIIIVLGIIAVIGIIVGLIIMKRRKSTIQAGVDDTQIWR